MEYYFQNELGLLAILPYPELPSAVQLRVAATFCGHFISAEAAANAVASKTTGHAGLDALPSEAIPSDLRGWQPSLPLHFVTGNSNGESSPAPEPDLESERLYAEAALAL